MVINDGVALGKPDLWLDMPLQQLHKFIGEHCIDLSIMQ